MTHISMTGSLQQQKMLTDGDSFFGELSTEGDITTLTQTGSSAQRSWIE